MTNADEMARFLTSINPSWKKEDWNKMLTNHVRFSRQLAQHYLNGSYEDALRVMDEDYMNSLNMADKMSEGIINQFLNNSKELENKFLFTLITNAYYW